MISNKFDDVEPLIGRYEEITGDYNNSFREKLTKLREDYKEILNMPIGKEKSRRILKLSNKPDDLINTIIDVYYLRITQEES